MSQRLTKALMSSAKANHFDFLVIGGGSGGMASARRAGSMYNKRVALVEMQARLGGTCVNVGCVPKKIMFNAATLRESLTQYAGDHQIHSAGSAAGVTVDFFKLKQTRDAYIKRLNVIYETNIGKAKVHQVQGIAEFVDDHTVQVVTHDGGSRKIVETLTADHILIATGGTPTMLPIPGIKFAINSDGFFDLEALPKNVVVIGSGYIGVELAGILNALGSKVTLVMRSDKPLRHFDTMLQDAVLESLRHSGVTVMPGVQVKSISSTDESLNALENWHDVHTRLTTTDNVNKNSFTLALDNQDSITGVNTIICATGRHPNTEMLELDKTDVKMQKATGLIEVDLFQNTAVKGVYAIGDVSSMVALTPVAIAAGRRLVDRLFGDSSMSDRKLDYENVPSVVFSHPPCGAVGLTEPQARQKFGDGVKVYTSKFNNLYYALSDVEHKTPTHYKVIVQGKDEKVVGIHLFGMASDEVLQGFAVALKMGVTKRQLDDTVAIHPTAGEELVTMP